MPLEEKVTQPAHDVIAGLAYMAAEACMKSLEVAATNHAVGTHLFADNPRHALTVTWAEHGYVYRLHGSSGMPRTADRETAVLLLADDKAIRALQ